MALKQRQWDTPNKMHMDSGYKLFDKQTVLISTGNVLSPTQHSSYIRPWNEVDNYGYKGVPGQFCKYDMNGFNQIPEHIRSIIYDEGRETSVILYEFRVWHGNEEKEIIGHVLTTGHDEGYKYIAHKVYCPYGCSFYKREKAINEAMKYICDDGK